MNENPPNETDGDESNHAADSLASTPYSGSTYKVLGRLDAPDGAGVVGHNTATSGRADGVVGVTESSTFAAAAVRAKAPNGGRGVQATAEQQIAVNGNSTESIGVDGHSTENVGTSGSTDDGDFAGVQGLNFANSNPDGAGSGVEGKTEASGTGATGVAGLATASTGETYGVRGETASVGGGAAGVHGVATEGSGSTYGVRGTTKSADEFTAALFGYAPNGAQGLQAISETGTGGYVYTTDGTETGLVGETTASRNRSGAGRGVLGRTSAVGHGTAGVEGRATAGSGTTYGVKGTTASKTNDASGVYGESSLGGGYTNGVHGRARSAEGIGVFAEAPDGGGPALFAKATNGQAVTANGDVALNGETSVRGSLDVDDNFSKSSGMEAYLTSDFTVGSGSTARPIVPFDDTVVDQRFEFDTSTHEFVCEYAGDYQVEVSVAWSDLPQGTDYELDVYLNGTNWVASASQYAGGTGYQTISVSKTLLGLDAGDSLTVRVAHDDDTDRDIVGSTTSGSKRAYTSMTVAQFG